MFTNLVVNGDVANVGLTNDVDLADLAKRALYLDKPINTNGSWTVVKASVHGGSFLLPIEAKINERPSSVGQLIGETDSNEILSRQVLFITRFIS